MIHWVRLIRPINLAIIAGTMYGLGWFYDAISGLRFPITVTSDFFLLVFSTVLIAAAGNIINDVYDVFADAINKPDRLIIGKHVEMKKALLVYLIFNLIALFMATIISSEHNNVMYIVIHTVCIALLWLYSRYFKKQFLIGNVVVALLTAAVPLLVGYYFIYYPIDFDVYGSFSPGCVICAPEDELILYIAIVLGIFAFVLNLAREIVKDIEDVPGDNYAKARTLPIVLGTVKTKWIVITVLLGSLVLIGWVTNAVIKDFYLLVLPIITSAVSTLLAIFAIFRAETHKHYKLANYWLKLAMVAGLVTPVIWRLLF